MNPITIILILSIALGVVLVIDIISYIKLKGTIKRIEEEFKILEDQHKRQKETIIQYVDNINAKNTEIGKLKNSLSQYDFKFNEQVRLNNESEQSLKDIISEHDRDMRKQREKFEKFSSELHDKGTVIEFVKQAFKAGKANVLKLEDYIKEFKANL